MSFLSSIFGSSPVSTAEQQKFNEKKNELGETVHKQALLWIQNAQCQPVKGQEGSKNYIYCQKINNETTETVTCCVDVSKVLENTQVDYKSMIKGLSKTEFAAFNFYLSKSINHFNGKSLETPADVIKQIENIKNLKDSVILKVATLQFIGDFICDHQENSKMLADKYSKMWL